MSPRRHWRWQAEPALLVSAQVQVPVSSLNWPLTCVTNLLPTATTAAMSDSSYSGSEDEAPAETLESLFESSDDDDAAPPAPAPQEDDDGQLPVPDVERTTPDEPAPEAVPAEPDGHVNADGVLYREPRRPFTGTLWDALRNAFIRIDVDNRRLPTGGRPHVLRATFGYFPSTASAARSRRRFWTRSAWRSSSAMLNSLGGLARRRSRNSN